MLERPVKPRGFVVLAVGVVVSVLASAELVSAQKHRNSLRKHQERDEILYLPLAQGLDLGVGAFALKAVVVGIVVVASVSVLLAVFVVVLSVVAYDIVHRKAVVAGDVIDRGGGAFSVVKVQVA